MKIDFISFDNTEYYNIVHEGDNGHSLADKLQQKQSVQQSVARELLQEVTGAAYSRLSTRFITETNIDRTTLPTLHILTKDQHKIFLCTYLGNINTGSSSSTTTTVETTDVLQQIDNISRTIKKTRNMDCSAQNYRTD